MSEGSVEYGQEIKNTDGQPINSEIDHDHSEAYDDQLSQCEEKVELDLRSSARPPSGDHSLANGQQSLKSEPMEKKQLAQPEDDDDRLGDESGMDSINSSFDQRSHVDHQTESVSHTPQPPVDGETYMRIEGATPESAINIPDDQRSFNSHSSREKNLNIQDNGSDEEDVHHRNNEGDNESDKTVDNDQEQHKLAQAKRMFIIQEVDEDTFSERSRDKSQIFSQKDQSVMHQHQENYLESLKEEREEEEETNLQLLKHHQTLNMENDLSNLNASQDIDPHNSSAGNAMKANLAAQKNKEVIKVEEDGHSSPEPEGNGGVAKTW